MYISTCESLCKYTIGTGQEYLRIKAKKNNNIIFTCPDIMLASKREHA